MHFSVKNKNFQEVYIRQKMGQLARNGYNVILNSDTEAWSQVHCYDINEKNYAHILKKLEQGFLGLPLVTFLLLTLGKHFSNKNDVEFNFRINHGLVIFPFSKQEM